MQVKINSFYSRCSRRCSKTIKICYDDGDKKYHIHIINSVETIGDSASKIKPDCKKKNIYIKKISKFKNTTVFLVIY